MGESATFWKETTSLDTHLCHILPLKPLFFLWADHPGNPVITSTRSRVIVSYRVNITPSLRLSRSPSLCVSQIGLQGESAIDSCTNRQTVGQRFLLIYLALFNKNPTRRAGKQENLMRSSLAPPPPPPPPHHISFNDTPPRREKPSRLIS